MKPLLNKDFRRLRWLLRQQPPKRVLGSSTSSVPSFLWSPITLADYLVREVASLAKSGIKPVIFAMLRNSLQRAEPKIAHVVSVLCFVSRMRLRDRGGTNTIPLTSRVAESLYRFFEDAALYGPVSDQHCSLTCWLG